MENLGKDTYHFNIQVKNFFLSLKSNLKKKKEIVNHSVILIILYQKSILPFYNLHCYIIFIYY